LGGDGGRHDPWRVRVRLAFYDLKRYGAPGVGGITWQDYEADLDRWLASFA